MNVLYCIETLTTGGAEIFALRLAKAFQSKGHKVFVYSFYPDLSTKQTIETFGHGLEILSPKIPFDKIIRKLDGLFYKMGLNILIREKIVSRHLNKIIRNRSIDVVHSHLFNVDYVAAKALKGFPDTKHIITNHGNYMNFYGKVVSGKKVYGNLRFHARLKYILNHAQSMVCISDKQLKFIHERLLGLESRMKVRKIYNGFTKLSFIEKSRKELGIKNDEFIYGMVSRDDKRKGWEVAIKAFLACKDPKARLILVGDGPHLKTLQKMYIGEKGIHFVGFSNNPLEWVSLFDVGLLPTTYPSESLPTVIIEYLSLNKPVVASNTGEIDNMISTKNYKAGITVPIENNQVSILKFIEAMNHIKNHYSQYTEQDKLTEIYASFDMNTCYQSYLNVYQS